MNNSQLIRQTSLADFLIIYHTLEVFISPYKYFIKVGDIFLFVLENVVGVWTFVIKKNEYKRSLKNNTGKNIVPILPRYITNMLTSFITNCENNRSIISYLICQMTLQLW